MRYKHVPHVSEIEAPVGSVYRALSTPAGLKGWLASDVSGDIRAGSLLKLVIGDSTPVLLQNLSLQPGRLVAWSCVDGPGPWAESRLRFELRPTDQGTRLAFRHIFLDGLERSDYNGYVIVWGAYLANLDAYVAGRTAARSWREGVGANLPRPDQHELGAEGIAASLRG